MYIRPPKIANKCIHTRGLACWTKLIKFQLYRGGQLYWWRKPEYPKKTCDLSQVTNKRYHIVASSTPRHVGYSNFSGARYWLHNTYDLEHIQTRIHSHSIHSYHMVVMLFTGNLKKVTWQKYTIDTQRRAGPAKRPSILMQHYSIYSLQSLNTHCMFSVFIRIFWLPVTGK